MILLPEMLVTCASVDQSVVRNRVMNGIGHNVLFDHNQVIRLLGWRKHWPLIVDGMIKNMLMAL